MRSTVVDLGERTLFVHSPVQIAVAREPIQSLGHVTHIVSPNKLHHLFLEEWKAAFPDAKLYAPPGLRAKRPDLPFEAELGDEPLPAWANVLDQRVVWGSFFMNEALFFHRPSRTLLVGDLIENHDPQVLGPLHRFLARANAMLAPHGTTPRNYRLSFFGRSKARKAMQEVLQWEPRRIVVMHGPCIEENAPEFLRQAFRWLL